LNKQFRVSRIRRFIEQLETRKAAYVELGADSKDMCYQTVMQGHANEIATIQGMLRVEFEIEEEAE